MVEVARVGWTAACAGVSGALPGLGCHGLGQPIEVGLVRRLPVKAGVGSPSIVEGQVPADRGPGLADPVVGPEIHLLVLDRSPEPLDEDVVAPGAVLLPHGLHAQQSLVPTPQQTAGPFYPVQFPEDIDNDLVQMRGVEAHASGVVTHVMGRVLGTDGKPIPNATVEIWQCDAHGRYLHPADTGKRPRDTAFQGYGRMTSGADGAYQFRTIRPVAYPGRTPHIHFAVRTSSGRQLVTQM